MSEKTHFFLSIQPGEDSSSYELLDIIISGLEKIPYVDFFEIIGCYALNKQIDSRYSRETRDIDLSVQSKSTWDYILNNITDLLNNSQDKFQFKIIKHRGFEKNPNSDSITFEIKNTVTGDTRSDIKIDMNIKEISKDNNTKIGVLHYADIYTMLANKLYVASTPRIYRRVKDFYDIHTIINSKQIQFDNLIRRFQDLYHINSNDSFEFFKEDFFDKLKHAYEHNSLFSNKEDFESFYQETIQFIQIFYMEFMSR